jgi:flavin reductase (DIM6/NTAB) family NADH-FMN oxidoreductase RutF
VMASPALLWMWSLGVTSPSVALNFHKFDRAKAARPQRVTLCSDGWRRLHECIAAMEARTHALQQFETALTKVQAQHLRKCKHSTYESASRCFDEDRRSILAQRETPSARGGVCGRVGDA